MQNLPKQGLNYDIELITLRQKGEIAHYEQFLLLPQGFQNSSASDATECVCKGKALTYK